MDDFLVYFFSSMAIVLILAAALFVGLIVCNVIMYRKAGNAGWEALVPFYSYVCMLRMIGLPWWVAFGCLIPYVNVVFNVVVMYLWLRCYGVSIPMFIGYLLLPVPFAFIITFSEKYDYLGPAYDYCN